MRTIVWQAGIAAVIYSGTLLATAQAGQMTTLHDFCTKGSFKRCPDAYGPGGVMQDAAGNLFGVTTGGGGKKGQRGTIYEMVGGTQYHTLYKFCPDKMNCTDGEYPSGRPIMDVAGNLYGTSIQGGNSGTGVVFELVRNGDQWTYKKLYDFCQQKNCTDGASLSPGLTYAGQASGAPYDGSSPLYGTTISGSAQSFGAVFQLTPGQDGVWQENVLHAFSEDDGEPSGLFLDSSGRFFGNIGTGYGSVFELSPDGSGWDYSTVYKFCSESNCTDGQLPRGRLTEDANGVLYGAAGGGACQIGSYGCGVVFRLAPHGKRWRETVLYAFCQQTDCADGMGPTGNLQLDAAGNLFGTTYNGGGNDGTYASGGGTVFELVNSKRFRKLYSFCTAANCADGANPISGVLITPQHTLIGDTTSGGTSSTFAGGVLYELQP